MVSWRSNGSQAVNVMVNSAHEEMMTVGTELGIMVACGLKMNKALYERCGGKVETGRRRLRSMGCRKQLVV